MGSFETDAIVNQTQKMRLILCIAFFGFLFCWFSMGFTKPADDNYDFGGTPETSTVDYYEDELKDDIEGELAPSLYTMNPTVGDTTFLPTVTTTEEETPELGGQGGHFPTLIL